jgi:hypothetical protein
MVTGDNLQTAKAIAEECGICTEGGIAIEGKTFRAMTIEQQYNVIPSIDVKLKPYFSLSSKNLSLFSFFGCEIWHRFNNLEFFWLQVQ